MQTASILARMIGGEEKEFNYMEEFDWLFTAEEHREAKRRRLDAAIHIKGAP